MHPLRAGLPTDPAAALLTDPDGVLAIVTGTEGPAYRSVGAMMAFRSDGGRLGQLSSGCIESDLALHADAARRDGQARQLRYGRGSSFTDLTLPCGGGLDVRVIPRPDPVLLVALADVTRARLPVGLDFTPDPVIVPADQATVRYDPPTRFLAFGEGEELRVFAGMVQAANYPLQVWGRDDPALHLGGIDARPLGVEVPDLDIDPWTAVVLFFHDHDREPAILQAALDSPAFWIGAQGSRRTAANRLAALRDLGVSQAALSRVRGPIGLIPSARNPAVLAVSVLAEILAATPGATR